MYFHESDILAQADPEYEQYIKSLDEFLGKLSLEEARQLDIKIVADIINLHERIVAFLFEKYVNLGLLIKKKFIICLIQEDVIREIKDNESFPLYEICDICGTEHIFTGTEIVYRYSLANKTADLASQNGNPSHEKSALNSSRATELIPSCKKIDYPEIVISERSEEIITIGVIQLDFKLSIDSFPPLPIGKEAIMEQIDSLIEIAVKNNAKIICLPELCICKEWLSEIEAKFSDVIIIAGSYYDEHNHNRCKILMLGDKVPDQMKIKPSEFETAKVVGDGMCPGEKIYIYKTKMGRFSVLICRDFGNFVGDLRDRIDILFVPAYNESPARFEDIANLNFAHVGNKERF